MLPTTAGTATILSEFGPVLGSVAPEMVACHSEAPEMCIKGCSHEGGKHNSLSRSPMSRHAEPAEGNDFFDPFASAVIPNDIHSVQLGVWRVLLRRPSSLWSTLFGSKSGTRAKTRTALLNVVSLVKDVYSLGRRRFVIVVLSHVLSGARATLALWTSNRLLLVVSRCRRIGRFVISCPAPQAETAIRTGRVDRLEMQTAMTVHVAHTLLVPVWDWCQ